MNTEAQLRRVFADVFGIEAETVSEDDSPESIESWDSVAHLNLVLALEGEFKVRFEAEEIPELISFGAIRERLKEASGAGA